MPQKALIPTVDISSFLADPSSPEAALAISQIRDACMSVGFFQITSHGISSALQESVFLAAKTFFALPQDVKNSYGGVQGRGYEVIGSQALDPSMAPDLKEVPLLPLILLRNASRAH
jgi:isopenicillin N synthase-like dioxygenase